MLDVTDRAAIREVIERSFARLGRIDAIVTGPITDATVLHGGFWPE